MSPKISPCVIHLIEAAEEIAMVVRVSLMVAFLRSYPMGKGVLRRFVRRTPCAARRLLICHWRIFNRAILRCFGSIIGTLIAACILSLHPAGIIVAIINMILTVITELVVVRNYALIAMFITPKFM